MYNRIVIKIGTSTLTHKTGLCNIKKMENIVKVIADIKNSGKEVVVVTSGAVGIGAGKLKCLNLHRKNKSLKQACASVGQRILINLYSSLFSKYGYEVAQLLLNYNVLDSFEDEFNVKNIFDELFKRDIIPIVNANDTVFVKELEFKDNDSLSAAVSLMVEAKLLIILSDIDGIYDKNPNENVDAKLIKNIDFLDDYLKEAEFSKPNFFGTGGISTKLKAAKIISSKKIPLVILNGEYPERIYDVFNGVVNGTLIKLK